MCKNFIGNAKCAFLNLIPVDKRPSRFKMRYMHQKIRSNWNLHALILKSNTQNSHSLPTSTYIFTSSTSGVTDMLSAHAQKDHSLYQSWAGWYHLTQSPCRIFSVDALLLCSPKGTFGKVWQHKTQHQMLLLFKNTAWRQCSTFIHELVRRWNKHAHLSLPQQHLSSPLNQGKEVLSFWPCQSGPSYASSGQIIWDLNTLTVYKLLRAHLLLPILSTKSFFWPQSSHGQAASCLIPWWDSQHAKPQ